MSRETGIHEEKVAAKRSSIPKTEDSETVTAKSETTAFSDGSAEVLDLNTNQEDTTTILKKQIKRKAVRRTYLLSGKTLLRWSG